MRPIQSQVDVARIVIGGLIAESADVPDELASHRNLFHEVDLAQGRPIMPRMVRVRHHRGMTLPHLELPLTLDGYIAVISFRTPDGATAWEAFPPEGEHDAWVQVGVGGDEVSATSWSGWQLRYDLTKGEECSRTFTK